MKLFFIKILLILVPIIGIIFAMEYKLGTIDNSYSYKRKSFFSNAKTYEVIILGSSQAYMGINPDFFSYKGYNLADVSQSLLYDYELFKFVQGSVPKLKFVILPISYFTLGYELSQSDEYFRCYFYERFWGIPVNNESIAFNIKRISLFFLYGNTESFSYLLKNFHVNLYGNITTAGFYLDTVDATKNRYADISEKKGKDRVLLHNNLMNDQNVSQNMQYLEKIIVMCKDKGIHPILITTPTFCTYYKNINSDLWQSTKIQLSYLEEKYSIKFYDYSMDSRFDLADFRDNDHLNPTGAKKLSRIINDEILIDKIYN